MATVKDRERNFETSLSPSLSLSVGKRGALDVKVCHRLVGKQLEGMVCFSKVTLSFILEGLVNHKPVAEQHY